MQAAHSFFELLVLCGYLFGNITIIGLVLYWLDTWLDQDIAAEQAETAAQT